jgi:hypothetical protein
MKYKINLHRDFLVNICEFNEFVDKNPERKLKEIGLCHCKTRSDGNSTFVFGDTMMKAHMGN